MSTKITLTEFGVEILVDDDSFTVLHEGSVVLSRKKTRSDWTKTNLHKYFSKEIGDIPEIKLDKKTLSYKKILACSNCGELLEHTAISANKCQYCHSPLFQELRRDEKFLVLINEYLKSKTESVLDADDLQLTCKGCGKLIKQGDIFWNRCSLCGTKISDKLIGIQDYVDMEIDEEKHK